MRWLVGWSSAATGSSANGAAARAESRTVLPVGAQRLWAEPDPLWAVGDWRPDEVRVVQADPETRLAVFGVWAFVNGAAQLFVALRRRARLTLDHPKEH